MQQPPKSGIVPIFILGAFFFIFGFVTWLNGTLIPYLKIACQLNTSQSLLVAGAFYLSYFFMALPSSWILKKTGLKKGMMLGLLVMSAGALIFIPAAQTRTYGLFLTGLFVIGTGLTILQAASNPYITIVGPIESAARRISIMGICNKVAGVLAPLILGAIILSDADTLTKDLLTLNAAQKIEKLNELASRVIMPYTFMAGALAFLAFLVRFSPLPEIESEQDAVVESISESKTSILQFPNLILGVIALFLYVGIEVVSVDTISLFGQSLGVPLSISKNFASYTLASMVIGYILGVMLIPKVISQSKALTYSAILGILLSVAAIQARGISGLGPFTGTPISILFIALLGFANAIMWPAIWPLAIHGLGKFTKTGSALLIMAIVGGACLSWLYGRLADIDFIGHQKAYWILVPCYIVILFYSTTGHKLKNWSLKG